MSRVRGVLDYAGCFSEAAGSVNSVNGLVGLRDGLGFVHDLLSFIAILARAGAIPSCDTTGKNIFVVVGESRSSHAKFPSPPEKVEVLVSFLNCSVGMEGPGQVVDDLDT